MYAVAATSRAPALPQRPYCPLPLSSCFRSNCTCPISLCQVTFYLFTEPIMRKRPTEASSSSRPAKYPVSLSNRALLQSPHALHAASRSDTSNNAVLKYQDGHRRSTSDIRVASDEQRQHIIDYNSGSGSSVWLASETTLLEQAQTTISSGSNSTYVCGSGGVERY
jgi:hypothetical protein